MIRRHMLEHVLRVGVFVLVVGMGHEIVAHALDHAWIVGPNAAALVHYGDTAFLMLAIFAYSVVDEARHARTLLLTGFTAVMAGAWSALVALAIYGFSFEIHHLYLAASLEIGIFVLPTLYMGWVDLKRLT